MSTEAFFAAAGLHFAVSFLWKGTVLVLAAGGLAWVLRRSSADLRHQIWQFTVLGLVLLGALSLGSGFRQASLLESLKPAGWEIVGLIFLSLWVLGAVALWLSLATAMMAKRRLRREATSILEIPDLAAAHSLCMNLGIESPVPLLVTRLTKVPMTWGGHRPIVLVPEEFLDWPEAARTSALAHELAHVRRGDAGMKLVAKIACALFWFHPLLWWASRRLDAEAEMACDDQALDYTPAPEYAELLVRLAREAGQQQVPQAAMPLALAPVLPSRIDSILDARRDRRTQNPRAPLMATLSAIVLLSFGRYEAGPVFGELSPEAKTSLVAPSNPEKRTISGRILDAEGRPLEGVNVFVEHLYRGRSRDLPRSDEDGYFRTEEELVPGPYEVTAVLEGYTEKVLPRVDTRAGDIENLEIRLDRGVRVYGRLLGLPPRAAKEAKIYLRGDRRWVNVGETDEAGNYQVSGLTPGTWELEARQDREGLFFHGDIVVGKSTQPIRMDISLQRGLAVSGLFEVAGQPVPGAWFRLDARDDDNPFSGSQNTDREGRVGWMGVPPGKYYVWVSWPMQHGGGELIYKDTVELTTHRDLVIELGCGRISGIWRDPRNQAPVPGIEVWLRGLTIGPEEVPTLISDDEGRFDFGCLPDGRYSLDYFLPQDPDRRLDLGSFEVGEGNDHDLDLLVSTDGPPADDPMEEAGR